MERGAHDRVRFCRKQPTHPTPPGAPTCTHTQIIDYGKFKYSQEKKKKEQKKKAKTTEVKEVKMSYKIENHDYGVRMKQVSRTSSGAQRPIFPALTPATVSPHPPRCR